MSVRSAAEALAAALSALQGVRVYTDPGATVDPPAAVVGPPRLAWESAGCGGPTTGTFLVYVAVQADEQALPRLWDLVELVAAAVDTVPEAAVTGADPGALQTGGVELPCYELTVEIGL